MHERTLSRWQAGIADCTVCIAGSVVCTVAAPLPLCTLLLLPASAAVRALARHCHAPPRMHAAVYPVRKPCPHLSLLCSSQGSNPEPLFHAPCHLPHAGPLPMPLAPCPFSHAPMPPRLRAQRNKYPPFGTVLKILVSYLQVGVDGCLRPQGPGGSGGASAPITLQPGACPRAGCEPGAA